MLSEKPEEDEGECDRVSKANPVTILRFEAEKNDQLQGSPPSLLLRWTRMSKPFRRLCV
jgi:hypothetical protein